MNKAIIWVIVAAVVLLGAWMIFGNRADESQNIPNQSASENEPGAGPDTGNEADPLANLPVVGTQASADEIVVESPKLGDKVGSPITVSGKARGSWYFEASAPVMVIDTTGKILGRGHVEAQGDWMTAEFVPFKGTITFDDTSTEGGAIVFMNDNPSGDEARSKYLAVPVFFR